MLNWLTIIRSLGAGLLAAICAGIAVKVIVGELGDTVRRVEILGAFSSLQQWAGKNGYTILIRRQVWDSPFSKNVGARVVFRVVVQDGRGERLWAWVRPGGRFEVKWSEPETWSASPAAAISPSNDDPLWDRDLDS